MCILIHPAVVIRTTFMRLKSGRNLFRKRMSLLKCMLACVTGIHSPRKLLNRDDEYLVNMQHTVLPSWYQREGYIKAMSNLIEKELKSFDCPKEFHCRCVCIKSK
ncbi:hypothetical protein P8452_45851 [Trifolium repens]|nr:hypothetical protein P8452_45851 [Trifolium repens]